LAQGLQVEEIIGGIEMEEERPSGTGENDISDDLRFSPRPNRAHEINWQPWGEKAFKQAAAEDKPILLSISAVWCHWCHVMDETSYSDAAVIDLVNDRYVPIRIDSDRNPDINRRYNQGGWPTTAFLSSEGQLLAGATYVPPEAMRKHSVEIEEPAGEALLPEVAQVELSLDQVREAGSLLLKSWDRTYGGLGTAPKFPQVDAVSLALELFCDEGEREYLHFFRSTLEAMIRGNLLDKIEGGFFRYSTTRDWSIPHYEKMLADNAALISLSLKAYSLTAKEIYRRTAAETAEYIRSTLSDGESRFYGSQDADEEYYLLKAEERKKLTPPPVDKTVYTDLASQAAVAFMEAGLVLGRQDYIALAHSSLDFLWSACYLEGEGLAHYHNGEPRRWGLLEDQASAAKAYLQAYGYSGREDYLRRAEALLRLVVSDHWDDNAGVLYDTTQRHALAVIKPEPADINIQAQAAEAMLHYWALSGEEEWRSLAGRILVNAAWSLASFGILAAPYIKAVNMYLRGPTLVKITGPAAGKAQAFLRTSLLSPFARLIPLLSGKDIGEGEVEAEVCTTEACQLHTKDLNILAEHLEVGPDVLKGGKLS
jgi:uncharacterized protein YyaL (SSP411 family)